MSQFFEQALAAKLASIPEVTALLGTQSGGGPAIFSGIVPQTWLYDNGAALTYLVPTKPRGHVLTGSDGTAIPRVQLEASSYSYGLSKRIVEAIWNAIDGVPGAWGDGTCVIMSVVHQDDTDLPSTPKAGSDQPIFSVISEYNIKYRVAIPSLT